MVVLLIQLLDLFLLAVESMLGFEGIVDHSVGLDVHEQIGDVGYGFIFILLFFLSFRILMEQGPRLLFGVVVTHEFKDVIVN